MGRIQILEKEVAELIAAGEVVERPSSIVKELLENSIDAGATNIAVEIKNGGVSYIRIADNGSGIFREDIPRAFLRHATSKVRSAADLDQILTLGFRGEALASVAAVCRVELTTKAPEEEEGTTCRIEGGELLECVPAGCPDGTTIVVRDIFYNTPARMKFLKRDVAEGNAVALAVEKCAFSHPEIAFRFIRDGQVRLRTSGNGDLKSVAYSVYGRDFANNLLPVEYTFDGIRVVGFVGDPSAAKPSWVYQNFFIDGRYVRTRTCSAALEEAFKTKIMAGRFPACVLNLQIEAGAVDVNVHPAKIEVRFVNEKPVYNAVYFAVKTALSQLEKPVLEVSPKPAARQQVTPLTLREPVGNYPQQRLTAREFRRLFDQTEENGNAPASSGPPVVLEEERPRSFHQSIPLHAPKLDIFVSDEEQPCEKDTDPVIFQQKSIPESDIIKTEPFGEPETKPAQTPGTPAGEPAHSFRLVGELFHTYILLQDESAMLLVDKHAAHERLQYEKLISNLSYGNRQVLLAPLRVGLSKEDCSAVLENLDKLEALGFGVEDFGDVLLVREVPIELGEEDVAYIIGEIAAKLRSGRRDLTPEALERLYYSIACKSAVRAGDKNHPLELEALVERLSQNPQITHCPHGRPVSVRLSKHDIEKMFGRLG